MNGFPVFFAFIFRSTHRKSLQYVLCSGRHNFDYFCLNFQSRFLCPLLNLYILYVWVLSCYRQNCVGPCFPYFFVNNSKTIWYYSDTSHAQCGLSILAYQNVFILCNNGENIYNYQNWIGLF